MVVAQPPAQLRLFKSDDLGQVRQVKASVDGRRILALSSEVKNLVIIHDLSTESE